MVFLFSSFYFVSGEMHVHALKSKQLMLSVAGSPTGLGRTVQDAHEAWPTMSRPPAGVVA